MITCKDVNSAEWVAQQDKKKQGGREGQKLSSWNVFTFSLSQYGKNFRPFYDKQFINS